MKYIQKFAMVTVLPIIVVLSISSCKDYLDAKPNKAFALPDQVKDLMAIMDAQGFSTASPSNAYDAGDDFYLPLANYNAIGIVESKANYIWAKDANNELAWELAYNSVLLSNIVIERAKQIKDPNTEGLKHALGGGLFFRAHHFYHLAQAYAPLYSVQNAAMPMGIPLRLEADITEPTLRSTIEQTYEQIIADFKAAAQLLPVQPLVKTRPSKPAAFAGLARVYLAMEKYSLARIYADSALQFTNELIDYNTLDKNAAIPFERFNKEVIFHASTSGRGGTLAPVYARVAPELYQQYADNDNRKYVFFRPEANATFSFKGSYTGSNLGQGFNGYATDELYLTRAECAVRLGDLTAAMQDLRALASKRYSGTVTEMGKDMDQETLLKLILAERRKELAFRDTRWNDLRRLNRDFRFAKTLYRELGANSYELKPNDLRYTFLIPLTVVEITKIAQNER